MNYLIRHAAEKDTDAVYQFICLLEENNLDYSNLDYSVFTSVYNKNIAIENYIYLVAESGAGTVIGFISCHTQLLLHHCGKVAEIQELYIDGKHRNLGIGKALLNEVEKRLMLNNCISFEVTAQNKRLQTHQFYENNGFLYSHKKFVKELC